jgi:hypothetical protein
MNCAFSAGVYAFERPGACRGLKLNDAGFAVNTKSALPIIRCHLGAATSEFVVVSNFGIRISNSLFRVFLRNRRSGIYNPDRE